MGPELPPVSDPTRSYLRLPDKCSEGNLQGHLEYTVTEITDSFVI